MVSFEKHSTPARQQQGNVVSLEKHSTEALAQEEYNADQERAKSNTAGAIESLGANGTMEALAAGLSKEEFAKIRSILEAQQDKNWIDAHEAEMNAPLTKSEIIEYTSVLAREVSQNIKEFKDESGTISDQKRNVWEVDPENDGLAHERAELELTDRAVNAIRIAIQNGDSLEAVRTEAERTMLEDDGRIFDERTGNRYERDKGYAGLGNPVEGRYAKMYWGGATTIKLLNDIEQNPALVRKATEDLVKAEAERNALDQGAQAVA